MAHIRQTTSFFDNFSIEARIPESNDTLLRSRDTNQLVLLKQMQVSAQEYEQTIASLEYQKKLSHQQLLYLVDYHPQPNTNKIMVLYEYCAISLQQQLDNRLSEQRYFQESQLWSIFTSLVFGLAYLQEQNVGHGSLSLFDCFLNQQGFIKVSDPTCASSNPYTIIKGYYYSPQIMRCLINQTGQQINIFKSDVFALGCCMLKLTLMRDIDELFDYQNGYVDKRGLQNLIEEIQTFGLSSQYVGFLNSILILDSCQRPDFVTLQTQIFSVLSIDSYEQSGQPNWQSLDIRSSISSMRKSTSENKQKILQPLMENEKELKNEKFTQNSKESCFSVINNKLETLERKPLKEFSYDIFNNNQKEIENSKTLAFPKRQPKSDSQISIGFKSIKENSFFLNPEKSAQQKFSTDKIAFDLQSSIQKLLNFNIKKMEVQKDFEKLDFGHKKKRMREKSNPNLMKAQLDLHSSFQTYCSKVSKNSSKTNYTNKVIPQTTQVQILTQKPQKTIIRKPQPTQSPRNIIKQTKELKMKNHNEDYSDPRFLKMMQEEMSQILNKRKFCY